MISGVTISNGVDWSLDGRTMYYVDSSTQTVSAFEYDVDTGAIRNPQPWVRVPERLGHPDGLTVDADGHVWVALWGGGQIHRYDPAGRLVAVLELPVPLVTHCTFGGRDLNELYVTTAARPVEGIANSSPLAGALFHCRLNVQGRRANLFAG
jgi:sugar lactone lactonase YvrE